MIDGRVGGKPRLIRNVLKRRRREALLASPALRLPRSRLRQRRNPLPMSANVLSRILRALLPAAGWAAERSVGVKRASVTMVQG